MAQSDEIANLAAALSQFQSHLEGAKKDSKNPFFKSSYADLESVWTAIREPLAKNGLSISQVGAMMDSGQFCIETKLLHASGEWISGHFPVIAAKANDPQSLGAAITYTRRFALAAICGVYQTDDDGNMAAGKMEYPTSVKDTHTPYKMPTTAEALALAPPVTHMSKNFAPVQSPKEALANAGFIPQTRLNDLESLVGPVMPMGKTKGTPLKDLPSKDLQSALDWMKKNNKFQDYQPKLEAELDKREKAETGEIPF